jgi:hypothetical protein
MASKSGDHGPFILDRLGRRDRARGNVMKIILVVVAVCFLAGCAMSARIDDDTFTFRFERLYADEE